MQHLLSSPEFWIGFATGFVLLAVSLFVLMLANLDAGFDRQLHRDSHVPPVRNPTASPRRQHRDAGLTARQQQHLHQHNSHLT